MIVLRWLVTALVMLGTWHCLEIAAGAIRRLAEGITFWRFGRLADESGPPGRGF